MEDGHDNIPVGWKMMAYKDPKDKARWTRINYWKRKNLRKCAKCGAGKTIFPHALCPSCREKGRVRSIVSRERYREEGRCPRCGQIVEDGYICCLDCLDKIPKVRGEYADFTYPDFTV